MRVAVTALGCKVSAYDATRFGDSLPEGFELVPFTDRADVYVVFSCTVTHSADRDTRKLVHRIRRAAPEAKVVLTGCLPAVDEARAAGLDGVDLALPHGRIQELPAALVDLVGATAPPTTPSAGGRPEGLRAMVSGLDRPYLKVQDGCNHACAYCVLPKARGRSRSVPVAQVLDELAGLEERGAREIVLTGIDLGSWGKDLRPRATLVHLLEQVAARAKARVRLSSLEPWSLTDDLLDLLAAWPGFCRHLHLPLQSGSDRILRAMGRPYTVDRYEDRVRAAVERLPGLGLGTDVICGFPGETDEDHDQTYATLTRLPFSYLHVFTYSPRPGTRAAAMSDDVPHGVKKARSRRLRDLGNQQREAACRALIGREVEVLVEGRPDRTTGRPAGYTREYLPALLDLPWDPTLRGALVIGVGVACAGHRLLVTPGPTSTTTGLVR